MKAEAGQVCVFIASGYGPRSKGMSHPLTQVGDGLVVGKNPVKARDEIEGGHEILLGIAEVGVDPTLKQRRERRFLASRTQWVLGSDPVSGFSAQ